MMKKNMVMKMIELKMVVSGDDDGCLGIGSMNARATLQLADPKVNQPAEYELTRGPFEYGGTWAPYE